MTTAPAELLPEPLPHLDVEPSAEERLDVVHADDHKTHQVGRTSMTLAEASTAILTKAVQIATSSHDTQPRPGQTSMINDIVKVMSKPEGDGQAVAEGPTGVGKSLVYLAAAAASYATTGNRSVVSTESLALQAQITDKDAPIIAQACQVVTGVKPAVAVLKGWSNYSCALSAVDTGNAIMESLGKVGDGEPRELARKLAKAMDTEKVKTKLSGDDELREKAELTVWALGETMRIGKPGVTGDKNAYPGNLTDSRSWDSVSVASSDCLGADRCSFADVCLPRAAREKAADADIVVTNHTLLGVQAANDIPVVIGSKTLGVFDHLFIDEAHGLPSTVRGQGSVEVSARAVKTVSRALDRILDDTETEVARLLDQSGAIASYVEDDLKAMAKKAGKDGVLRLRGTDDPMEASGSVLLMWLKRADKLVSQAMKATSSPAAEISLKRAKGRVLGLASALEMVSEDKPGSARWVEIVTPHGRAADQSPYPVARYTPVDVSGMLRWSIYTRPMTDEELEDGGYGEGPSAEVLHLIKTGGNSADAVNTAPDGPIPRKPLSVVALSATIPTGFPRQMGMFTQPVFYPSPFDKAYGNSVLFVPRVSTAEDVAELTSNRWGNAKFDTGQHRGWALKQMLDLVEANGGSALILSATAASGRVYADALAAHAKGRWKVMSQWDGMTLRRQVAAWKDDESAVMVGTRSLMTGVDAAGATCSLVVIDRPPRAAGNPVDDARVEQIVENSEMDRYAADLFVYVSDAGLLLEQAAGRLIRSVNDSGMVAVLDPRLLKSSPFAYKTPTRNSYLETLRRFETKIADPVAARVWLENRRDARKSA